MTSAEHQREKQELEQRINQMRADMQKKHQGESEQLKKDHAEELEVVKDRESSPKKNNQDDAAAVQDPVARKKKEAHANFDESKIKRDDDGKFGSGGGGRKSGKTLSDGVTVSGDTVLVTQQKLLSSIRQPKVPEYKPAKDAAADIVDYMQAAGKTDPSEAVESMIAENVHEDMFPQQAALVSKYEDAINRAVDKLTAGTDYETAGVEISDVSQEWHGKETGYIEDVAVEMAEKAGGEKLRQTLRQYAKDNAEKLSALYRKIYEDDE
jgi:hypothetical protein